MTITASHHERKSTDLDSLKKAFNHAMHSWESSNMETYFTLIHPEASYIRNKVGAHTLSPNFW